MQEKLKDTKALAVAALMTAFTCVATMIIHIPTPTLGYIHPGDCMVLLSGVILGPGLGGLAAGLGSCLADAFTGYTVYVIPTFFIKGLTAMLAAVLFRLFQTKWNRAAAFAAAGIIAECNMVFGYFINKIIKMAFLAGSMDGGTLLSGLTAAVGGLIPDTIQGVAGVVLGLVLLPVLCKVPDIRRWLGPSKKSAL